MECEFRRVKPDAQGDGPHCAWGRCCPNVCGAQVRAAHPALRPLRDPRTCGFCQAPSETPVLRMSLANATYSFGSGSETLFQRCTRTWVRRAHRRTTEYRIHRRSTGDKREGV